MRTLVLCLLTALLYIQDVDAQQPLDSTFGTNGILAVNSQPNPKRIYILPDGKIICAGSGYYRLADNSLYRFISKRLFPDGSLDRSYGSSGYVNSPINQRNNWQSGGGHGAVLQPDGKLLIAVTIDTGTIGFSGTNKDIYITRLHPDGSRDNSFGNYGFRIINLMFSSNRPEYGLDEVVTDIALQEDGKIIIGGYFPVQASGKHPGFMRLLPDGRIDSTFNDSGWVTTGWRTDISGYDPNVHDIGIDNQGRLLIGMKASPYVNGNTEDHFTALRFLPNGRPDSAYGNNGVATYRFPGLVYGKAMKVLPDGSALLAGYNASAVIIKFDSTGRTDSSFGNNGLVSIPDMAIFDMDIAPGGKIIAAGGHDYAIWRFHPNGSLDSSFGQNGISRLPMHEDVQNTVYTVKCYEDGSRIIAGGTSNGSYMFRYNTPSLSVPGTEASKIKDIELYPNPAHSSLYVQSKTGTTVYDKVQIVDIYGRSVKEIPGFRLEGRPREIQLSDMAPGTYFISFYAQGKAVERLRFVKL